MKIYLGLINLFVLFIFIVFFSGCAVDKMYWEAGTSVAFEEERKGNIEEAEIRLLSAWRRAKNHLTPEYVSNSLYHLGAFYLRQEEIPDAIRPLKKSIELEETISGPTSVRTGRRISALAHAYFKQHNLNEGRPLAERLRPIAPKFTGDERNYVDDILKAYYEDGAAPLKLDEIY